MKRSLFFVLALVAICVMPLYGQNPKTATTGTLNGHEWVDLGLPSGTLWATCNVGANAPEEYGDYFAWGETNSKDIYNWETYKYANGDRDMIIKYCNDSDFGNDGFTDTLTILLPEDDAATVNWGSGWQTPSKEQWDELVGNTTKTWTTQNGVTGMLITAKNGVTLFLPAAGIRWDSNHKYEGADCVFWSRSLNSNYLCHAWYLLFDSEGCSLTGDNRFIGYSLRPVTTSR